MGIRVSGLSSGFDTESIIKELMSAQGMKKTKVENKLTKLEWKEEIWEDLNTKITAFETGSLSKLKAQSSYMTKTINASNTTCATFSAGYSVPTGTHTVEVASVASAQYITGQKVNSSQLNNIDLANINANTKLSSMGIRTGTVFTLTKGVADGATASEDDPTFTVSVNTTMSDLTKWFSKNGVNFSYDSTNERFFLSSKESGTKNSFNLTCGHDPSYETKIRTMLDGYGDESAINDIMARLSSSDTATFEAALNEAASYAQNVAKGIADTFLAEFEGASEEDQATKLEQLYQDARLDPDLIDDDIATLRNGEATEEEKEAAKMAIIDTIKSNAYGMLCSNAYMYNGLKNEAMSALDAIGIGSLTYDGSKMTSSLNTGSNKVSVINSTNCKIIYNDADFESASNTQKINGLTINAIQKTTEPIKLNVTNDTEAVYNTIKTFVKDYNDLLKSLNTYYHAETAKGYDVLTDEQKDAMSDEQVEKWEKKIKDSLLRRDSNLSVLINTLQSVVSNTVTASDDKVYSIISLGISTKDYTEKGLLHIYGDKDDSSVQDEDDVLKKMLDSDPEKVMEVLSGIGNQMYSALTEQRKSNDLRSSMKYYDDKEITSQKKQYKSDISKLEDYLDNLENRYYTKFTAMEKALAKINSQTNYISSLFSSGS